MMGQIEINEVLSSDKNREFSTKELMFLTKVNKCSATHALSQMRKFSCVEYRQVKRKYAPYYVYKYKG